MKSKAAILVELNKPLVIDEIEIPTVSVGQVLVKVICSGICGSQIGEISGVKGEDKYLPHLLGHEGAGVVMETGEGVTTVKSGDHVVLHWRRGSGMQSLPPAYRCQSLGKVNAGWITTFNEYAIVSEDRLTTIPDDVDPEISALMGCAVTTGLGVINNNAHLKVGQSIVVWGAGGIGLSIVQGAAMVSAWPIIAVDLFDNRLALARHMGATHVVEANNSDPEGVVREIVNANGVDVVVDNTGNPEVIRRAYDLTAAHGRTILVGVPPKGMETSIYTLPLHFGKVMAGSHGGESQPDVDIPNYLRLYRNDGLKLNALVTSRYSLDAINVAIDDMRSGTTAGRCMIQMEGAL